MIGNAKSSMNSSPKASDDGEAEDQEAEEDEDVRQARDGPLEQLLLPEHLGDLDLGALGHVVGAPDGRLPAGYVAEQEPGPGHCEPRQQTDGQRAVERPNDHVRFHGTSLGRRKREDDTFRQVY